MAVLSAHEKEVLEGSHGTNPAAVYQPKKPGRAISESVRRMILRQSFIKRLNHRNQQDAKPDVGLGMLAAMSRISQARQCPAEHPSLTSWSIPPEEMSLHSGKYRSAVREAEVTWQVRQGEEAETTGHQGRQGRKAKADPVRAGKQTGDFHVPADLFKGLQSGKNLMSPKTRRRDPWDDQLALSLQAMEHPRSWTPLSAASDTTIPDASNDPYLIAPSRGQVDPRQSLSSRRTRPASCQSPPPGRLAVPCPVSRPVPGDSSQGGAHKPAPGSRCNLWQSRRQTARTSVSPTRPASVQGFNWDLTGRGSPIPPRPSTAHERFVGGSPQLGTGSEMAARLIPARFSRSHVPEVEPSAEVSMDLIQQDAMRHQHDPAGRHHKVDTQKAPAEPPRGSRWDCAGRPRTNPRWHHGGLTKQAIGRSSKPPETVDTGSPAPEELRGCSTIIDRLENEGVEDFPAPEGFPSPEMRARQVFCHISAPPRAKEGALQHPQRPPRDHRCVSTETGGAREKDQHLASGESANPRQGTGEGSMESGSEGNTAQQVMTGDSDRRAETPGSALKHPSAQGPIAYSNADHPSVKFDSTSGGGASKGSPPGRNKFLRPGSLRIRSSPLQSTKSGQITMEMIHPDGLKEPRPPDFYDAENDEGGISSLADSSSAQDPQDPTPLHKVMEPMNGAVSGSRGKEVNGGAAPFSVDVAEELKSKSNDDLKADPSAKRKTPSSVNVLDAKFVPYQAPKAEVAAVQEPEVDAGPRTESQRLQSHVKTIVNDLMVAKGLHWLPEDRISLPTMKWVLTDHDDISSAFINDEEKRRRWQDEVQRVTSVNEREKATSEGRMAEARVAKDRIKHIVGRADTGAAKAVRQVRNTVRFSRAQFQLAVAPKREYGHYAEIADRVKKAPIRWSLRDSIFVRRLKECESKDFFDKDKVQSKSHDIDWLRVVAKERFRNFIARKDKDLLDPVALHRELREVYNVLKENLVIIKASFLYYSMLGGTVGESAWSMPLNNFTSFVHECKIIEQGSVKKLIVSESFQLEDLEGFLVSVCEASDSSVVGALHFLQGLDLLVPQGKNSAVNQTAMDTLFITVNFEENKKNAESKQNDDRALMRFEWYEIIVRTAVLKYGGGRETNDVSDAVQMLVDRNLKPNLPPAATEDSNEFRRSRFYTFENDQVIQDTLEVVLSHQERLSLLESVYTAYRAVDVTNYFWMEHWVVLLEDCQLIGTHTGISKFEAKIIYARAKMASSDELKRRQRVISHQFIDFLEALARISDLLSLPEEDEIMAWLKNNIPQDEHCDYPYWTYNKHIARTGVPPISRASAGLMSKKTRPVHKKLRALIDLMVGGLCEVWEAPSETSLVLKLDRETHALTRARVKPDD